MMWFFVSVVLVACGPSESRYSAAGTLSMVVPDAGQCKVLENTSSGSLMSASMHSRDAEMARFIRCRDSKRNLELTAFRVEYALPGDLKERLKEDAQEMGEYSGAVEQRVQSVWGP